MASALLCSLGCGSGFTGKPEAEATGLPLTAPLQVNPAGVLVTPGSFIRPSKMFVDPDGQVFITWTKGETKRLALQRFDPASGRLSKAIEPCESEDAWIDHPALYFDRGRNMILAVAWQRVGSRNRGGFKRIAFIRSLDGGDTWSRPVAVNQKADGFSPEMASDGQGNIYVVWKDERDGFSDLYFNRSRDYGETWMKQDVRLSPGRPGNGVSAQHQLLCEPGGKALLVFSHVKEGGAAAIYFRRTLDYGASWSPPARINDSPEHHMDFPQMVRHPDGKLAVTWLFVGQQGFGAIYSDLSRDDGATWGDDRIIYSHTASQMAYLHMRGWAPGRLSLLWVDSYQDEVSIVFKTSDDFGNEWAAGNAAEGRLNPQVGPRRSQDLFTTTDGDRQAAIWSEQHQGRSMVKSSYSLDRGKTWLAEPIDINPEGEGNYSYFMPQVAFSGDFLLLLYQRVQRSNEASGVFVTPDVDLFVRVLPLNGAQSRLPSAGGSARDRVPPVPPKASPR